MLPVPGPEFRRVRLAAAREADTIGVYLAYLDSVHFFKPKQYRTAVYHEILLGYLDYAKQLGYTMAHIWACPPSEGMFCCSFLLVCLLTSQHFRRRLYIPLPSRGTKDTETQEIAGVVQKDVR